MDDITITRHDEPGPDKPNRGEYHAHVPGSEAIGRLTWELRGTARAATHTLVPEAIGGRGIAGKLVDALIADARAQGFRIVPDCSYVVKAFEKHPEWADLKA